MITVKELKEKLKRNDYDLTLYLAMKNINYLKD